MCWTLSQSLPSSRLASHGGSKVSIVPILFLSLEAPSHSYGTLGRRRPCPVSPFLVPRSLNDWTLYLALINVNNFRGPDPERLSWGIPCPSPTGGSPGQGSRTRTHRGVYLEFGLAMKKQETQ